MDRNNFEIVGLNELIEDLSKFPKEAKKELRPANDEAGDVLLAKTKAKVPVDTGQLKDSLHTKPKKSRKPIVQSILTWGDDARDYAAPLELGHRLVLFGKRTWRSVAARPFLRPAADESKEAVFKILIAAIDGAIKKLGDR